MEKNKIYSRRDDMSPDGELLLMCQYDGDIIISIMHGGLVEGEVEFCTCGAGGGRSPNTRIALLALIEAIEKDNADIRHRTRRMFCRTK